MQLSQRRMLMKAQLPAWRVLAGNRKAIVAYEKAQLALFRSIGDDSQDFEAERIADDASDVEAKADKFAAPSAPAWFNLTDKLPIRISSTFLAGGIDCASAAGSIQLVCRYYDYEKQAIGIDFPVLADGSFCSPVPTDAHFAALGLFLGEGASVSIGGIRIAGIMPDDDPIDPDDLAASQNEIVQSFAAELEGMLARIPDSNGSAYYGKVRRPHVGIITDDFMFNYYADALDLEYLTPEGYSEQLSTGAFDFVLYVSCWLGLRPPDEEGLYEYRPHEAAKIVPAIFKKAHELGIPALFQSIEDPPSYELFLPIAKAADAIFTTAVEVIPKYVRDTGNPAVFYLPYGVNPLMHNPVGCMKKYSMEYRYHKDSVFFAGSWYGAYKDRCHDTALLFDAIARDAGKNLIIADRTLHFAPNKRRAFPSGYNEYIIEPIEHHALQKTHKLFDFAINLNTIKDSQTMGAMRVYEVQALGGLLVSNTSKSLANVFPDIFAISEDSDVKAYFDGLTQDGIVRTMIKGIRRIFSNATVYDRLNTIFLQAGLPMRYEHAVVHVFADVGDGRLVDSFGRQTYARKELHPISELDAFPDDEGFFAVLTTPYESDCFLEDAMNAFKYVDIDFVQALPFDRYADSFDYMQGCPVVGDSVFACKKALVGCMGEGSGESLDGFAIISV